MARKLAPDKWLFAATIGLALFGVVMVYSASAVMAQSENGTSFYYVIKQGVWTAIGFVVMLLAMQFNYQQLKIVASFTVCCCCTLGVGCGVWLSAAATARIAGSSLGFSCSRQRSQNSRSSIFLAYFLEKRAVKKETSGARLFRAAW
jgi:cell division protein FtsW